LEWIVKAIREGGGHLGERVEFVMPVGLS
jgi:hypothetical protein